MKSKDPAFQLGYFCGKVDPSNLQDFYGKNTLLLFWDLRSVTLWNRGSCLIFFFFKYLSLSIHLINLQSVLTVDNTFEC